MQRLAHALAKRGRNPVYLLTLHRSSHAHYALACPADRHRYACTLRAATHSPLCRTGPVAATCLPPASLLHGVAIHLRQEVHIARLVGSRKFILAKLAYWRFSFGRSC